MPNFPKYLNNVLVGLLLSDGGLEKASDTSNVRLSVNMSFDNYPYIFHLYNIFEPFIDTDLKIINVKSSVNLNMNKIYSTVRFRTISLPQLIYYYNIFYKKIYYN
jgi:LAGLIDADG DNA endonuclease family